MSATTQSPRPHSSAAAAADAPSPGGGALLERLNPLRSLRRHPFLALTLLISIGGVGLPVAFLKGKPVYYAEAVVYVSPRFIRNLQEDKEFEMQSNTQYREYVQQNVKTVNRFDIVSEALAASPVFRAKWLLPGESDRQGVERLQGWLSVKPIPDTYQISVGLEQSAKEGLAEFLNKLVESYMAKAKREEFYASDARIASLKLEADQLAEAITGRQEQKTALAQELGVTAFTENYTNPYDRLLVSAKEALAEARRKRIEAEAQVRMLEGPVAAGKPAAVEAFALEMASKDPAMTTVLATLNTRRTELMSRASGLSETHPGRVAALQEIREVEAEKQRTLDKLSAGFAAMLLDQRRAEARRAQQVEKGLSEEVDRQQSQASWFTRNYQDGIGFGLEIERSRKRLDSIDDRVRFLAQEGRAPGFVRMFSRALPPERPARGGRTRIFLMFAAGAFVLAVLAPVAVDVLDPRIFSPADAAGALVFPLMGWVPDRAETGEAFWHEQVLRIAHRIDQERTTHGSRIWCFTGAQAGSGTTTLVNAVGKALHQLGVPALTVEANAWRSDPRYRTESRSRGLSVVLRGDARLLDNIDAAGEELPDHLPLGDGDGSGHLPDVHRLMEVLEEAGSVYDAVLVDLPPILASVDAEYLSRRADVVVLVLRAVSLHKGELHRALRTLERNQPKAVSAVLNRVGMARGGSLPAREFEEFSSGAASPSPRWMSPWTWR
jgi:polysaccharide biosynthesis transport protein